MIKTINLNKTRGFTLMWSLLFFLNCNHKECPRKIRDKERSDVNEFFEWRL